MIKVITDSSCDLTLNYVEANNDVLDLLGMPVNFDEEEYIDDLGKTLTHEFLYTKLKEGIFPKTSQINTLNFLKKFKACYEKGEAVICIGLSSGLSGTINNAKLAKEMLLEEHEDADITIIDTLAASVGLGALVVNVIELIREGKSKEEIIKWIEECKLHINHWFAVDDLIHLKNGGRIPATTAYVGTALNIKPILTVTHNGKLEPYAKTRGRRKSLSFLLSKFDEYIGKAEDKIVLIGHANCREDAEKIKTIILEQYSPKDIMLSELSATIATHVGPGMIAIGFLGDYDRENA